MSSGVLVAVLTYNEGDKLKNLLRRFPTDRNYELLFVDDGSTDGSGDLLRAGGYQVSSHPRNLGVGAGIRTAIEYGKDNNLEIMVVMAANGKMLPEEIDRLLKPILEGEADYVQGSRNLAGGSSPNLPLFRKVAIKIFTRFASTVLGYNATDITCGFRAYKLSLLDHPEININQDWLGQYEMEYYIHYKVIKLGFNVVEVPVSMVYPEGDKNYSKIKPFVGWWSMIRPWVFLLLRLKK